MIVDSKHKNVWHLAFASVAWLSGVVAPALMFDIGFGPQSELDTQFRAFFQIFATVIFLIVSQKHLIHSKKSEISILAIGVILFVSYALFKDYWSCAYYDTGRVVIGSKPLPEAEHFIRNRALTTSTCLDVLSPFGGNAASIWARQEIVFRFLVLFGLYSLAWLSIALSVLAAIRTAIDGREARK